MSDTSEPDWRLSEPVWPSAVERDNILGLIDEVSDLLSSPKSASEAVRKELPRMKIELQAGRLLVEHGPFRLKPAVELLIKPMMHLAAHSSNGPAKEKAGALVRALLDLN